MDSATLHSLAAAGAIAVGVIGPAIAIGRIGAAALTSIGRNHEAASKVSTPMLLALAFAEALGIYAFVIAFLIK